MQTSLVAWSVRCTLYCFNLILNSQLSPSQIMAAITLTTIGKLRPLIAIDSCFLPVTVL
jgi:hypothetical protein